MFPLSIFNRSRVPSVAQLVEQSFAQSQTKRLQDIKRRWDYYRGNFPLSFKVEPNRPNDNTIINFARICVDKSVSFLFSGVDFEIEEQDKLSVSEEDRYLDAVWKQANKNIFLHQLGVNGAIAGHAFIKIKRDPRLPYPRLINLDPENVSVIWELEDYQQPVQFRIEWSGIDHRTARAAARRQIISRINENAWEIYDEISRGDGKWERLGQEKWAFPFAPIFHCQNLPNPNEFYGESDLTDDVIHINERINFVASNIARILRFHAHPKTWARGVSARELDMSVDSLITINTPDGVLQNLEMQSDLSSSLEFYQRLVDAFHEIIRIPDVAVGRSENLGALSGIALKLMFAPLIEKTQTKRALYGQMLTDLNDKLFILNNQRVSTICNWADPLPTDLQQMLALRDLGVSQKTILNQLGYNAETELAQTQAEKEQQLALERSIGEIALRAFDRGDL